MKSTLDMAREAGFDCAAQPAPVQPVALEWDEVFDAAAAAYCRSEASRKALRLCFQSRQQATQISIGWTANELMAFAKTITYICATPPGGRQSEDCLTAAPVQEPVAWVNHGENKITRATGWDGYGALYTTPPAAQRQWVGLTDEEVKHMLELFVIPPHHVEMVVRAIEAKLKEKNT